MSDGSSYADLIILALIAGFILLRLRSMLGQKSSDDNMMFFKKETPVVKPPEPIVQLDEKSLKPKLKDDTDPYMQTLSDSEVATVIGAVKMKDPQFTASNFLNGAKMAYEMVFDAFAKGDKPTLKMLLSDARFTEFSGEIDERAKGVRRNETTLVAVKPKEISHASLEKNTARLTVVFESEQVMVVRDAEGKIVEGDVSHIHHVEDHWTFERDITSKNPNWKIVET